MARGYFTQGQGNPDESRASRYILKDYVNAKLLYSHPPPGIDANKFNEETRELVIEALSHKHKNKRAPANRVGKKSSTFIQQQHFSDDEDFEENGIVEEDGSAIADSGRMTSSARPRQSVKANVLDTNFFTDSGMSSRMLVNGVTANASGDIARGALYPHQRRLDASGQRLSGRKMRELEAMGAIQAGSSKKHNKGNKRAKARSGGGYE